jgi:transcriptional regulator with PAS, ATPase and Fis domain
VRYGEIAKPLRDAVALNAGDSIGSALAAFAGMDADAAIVLVGTPPNGLCGFLTERALVRAIAANPENVKKPLTTLPPRALDARKETDPVDLRDFEREDALLILDSEGLPFGVTDRRTAARALLDGMIRRLSETAKRMNPLGGRDYAGNRIFCLDAYHSAEELYGLIDAIADNGARLQKILKHSSHSIYVADGAGVTLFANAAFEKPAGLREADYVNVPVEELSHRGLFDPPITPMVIRKGKSVTILQQAAVSGRATQWIVTGTPIFDGDGALEMVVTNAKSIEEYEKLKRYLEKPQDISFSRPTPQNGDEIICFGGRMKEALSMADKAAETDCTVLITGESGTGKGVLARYIHAQSARRNKSLIEVNCSSIPELLFESEFFGYETGAFTGAKAGGKPGLLEVAHEGTLLLDEIGDMALPLQAKLLKVLQDKRMTRVGGLREIEVDVRIIAASNRPLPELISSGLFRADLYYRLNLFPIHIVPLRDRPEDIRMLTDHFLRLFNAKHGKQTRFSDDAICALRERRWPGNVRQLEYFVERMVILHDGEIGANDLSDSDMRDDGQDAAAVLVRRIIPLQRALDETERQLFTLAAENGGSSYEIAKILDTSQTNAYRKIKKYLSDV